MAEHGSTATRIVEAAGPIFAAQGYDGTSVRDITEAAGTNPAAVSFHFRGKEQLYVATVRHAWEAVLARHPLPDLPPGMPAEERLREFIRTFVARVFYTDGTCWHIDLMLREVAQPRAGACAEFVQGFVRPHFEMLQGILRDLLPADVPAQQAQLIGCSIVGQCLHYHHARNVIPHLVGEEQFRALDVERITEHVWRFSLAALRGLYPQAQRREQG
jgi:AcrR family transcriptional regulator